MRQIIFVNEARVELAPPEYRVEDDVKTHPSRASKEEKRKKRDKHRAACEIVHNLRNDKRIRLAPLDQWEEPETKSPEVEQVMNKIDNPAYSSKRMQKIW